jgi:hypothetical protein
MFQQKSTVLRLCAALTIAGSLATGLSAVVSAQSLPGLTIFSGVERKNQLNYRLDYQGKRGVQDRYHLRIPADKLTFAVSKFAITYPSTYTGTFDPKRVEVRVRGTDVPLDDVSWDRENRVIEIYPKDPVPAANRVEIVLSNVRNPLRVGTHYFNAMVQSPGDLPVLRYVGTWIVSIGGEDNNSTDGDR